MALLRRTDLTICLTSPSGCVRARIVKCFLTMLRSDVVVTAMRSLKVYVCQHFVVKQVRERKETRAAHARARKHVRTRMRIRAYIHAGIGEVRRRLRGTTHGTHFLEWAKNTTIQFKSNSNPIQRCLLCTDGAKSTLVSLSRDRNHFATFEKLDLVLHNNKASCRPTASFRRSPGVAGSPS